MHHSLVVAVQVQHHIGIQGQALQQALERLGLGLRLPLPQQGQGLAINPQAPDFKPYLKPVPFYADMLGDTTVVNAMGTLLDSPASETRGLAFAGQPAADDAQPDLGFEFRLYKTPQTRGWFTGAFGGEDYTVLRMGLDVRPVRIQQPFYRALLPAAAASAAPAGRPTAAPTAH